MYGRETGDAILKKVADTITEVMEGNASLACRTEGDSFYLYCEHQEKYEALMDRITEMVGSDQGPAKIRLRAGVYQDADLTMDPETMFDRAKLACDRIKGDYTVTVAYYNNELYQKAIYQEHLIENIDQSIENEDFKVYFQPKYDITGDTPRLRSAEALIRWNHPELGMISPGDFIPLFESNGLIQKVDNFVWNKAAACIREWKDKYGYSVPVSVNVSRIDIFDSKLEEKLQNILKNNGITEKDLMLEITESAYSDNADSLTEVANRLRESGFMIEMDDFGSGYSSLNMITTLPIDVLKLDMKFVRNMEKDEKSLKLVELIIGIAGFLNVPVVAEGVETESQLKKLKDMGCQVIQGYYFSRPVPASEFEEFIKKECV
jgi:EAL domain-containing protein (putative c-di-GMP-specific phosphodiesterase class I)